MLLASTDDTVLTLTYLVFLSFSLSLYIYSFFSHFFSPLLFTSSVLPFPSFQPVGYSFSVPSLVPVLLSLYHCIISLIKTRALNSSLPSIPDQIGLISETMITNPIQLTKRIRQLYSSLRQYVGRIIRSDSQRSSNKFLWMKKMFRITIK